MLNITQNHHYSHILMLASPFTSFLRKLNEMELPILIFLFFFLTISTISWGIRINVGLTTQYTKWIYDFKFLYMSLSEWDARQFK